MSFTEAVCQDRSSGDREACSWQEGLFEVPFLVVMAHVTCWEPTYLGRKVRISQVRGRTAELGWDNQETSRRPT